ncbi:MAG: winged helix DNA-binding domain-containing protein [Actinomycetota bacterium]|nr:winged helix DNA-binding domain-containing protein [Actinomycetota bacterium]
MLSDRAARRLRLGAQRLHRPEPDRPVVDLVRRLCGVQAQALAGDGVGAQPELALRARGAGLTRGQVDRARLSERSIVWTWAMRGTLHLVAADDLGWLRPLVAAALRAETDDLARFHGLPGELVLAGPGGG